MNRPYIICHMLTSLDGKVTGDFLYTPTGLAASETYYEVNRLLRQFEQTKKMMKQFQLYRGIPPRPHALCRCTGSVRGLHRPSAFLLCRIL